MFILTNFIVQRAIDEGVLLLGVDTPHPALAHRQHGPEPVQVRHGRVVEVLHQFDGGDEGSSLGVTVLAVDQDWTFR